MKKPPVRPKEKFLIFGTPAIEEAEIEEVVASMRSGWLGTGPKVAKFESDIKAYKGAPYAVAEAYALGLLNPCRHLVPCLRSSPGTPGAAARRCVP